MAWHPTCILRSQIKYWLPGVAGTQPRLCSGFGGSVDEKGACTGPLFYFRLDAPEKPSRFVFFGGSNPVRNILILANPGYVSTQSRNVRFSAILKCPPWVVWRSTFVNF